MWPHIRDCAVRGCAGTSGAQMRTLTRYILERALTKKRLTILGLVAVMIGGAVTSTLS